MMNRNTLLALAVSLIAVPAFAAPAAANKYERAQLDRCARPRAPRREERGETQILGQVKDAAELASNCGTAGPMLHRALEAADRFTRPAGWRLSPRAVRTFRTSRSSPRSTTVMERSGS